MRLFHENYGTMIEEKKWYEKMGRHWFFRHD